MKHDIDAGRDAASEARMRGRNHGWPTSGGFPPAAFWWLIVGLAPVVAWAASAIGLGMPVGTPVADLTVLALWSVSEEVVFRGALQPYLAARLERRALETRTFAGITAANAATSLCFAFLHLWRHPPLVAVAALPVSLVLGLARDRTGRLWPPILLHLYFNALLYAASWLVLRCA